VHLFMSKRNQFIIIPALSVILAGLIIYFFFFHDKSKIYPPASLAIPGSTIAVYQGRQPEKLFAALRQTDIFHFLKSNAGVRNFERDFLFFDSLISSKEKIRKLYIKNPIIVSLHVTGTASIDLLFLNQTEEAYNKDEIFNLFKDINSEFDFTERNFEGKAIYDTKDRQKNNVFSFTLLNGILALSKNPVLVEDAINAYTLNNKKSEGLIDSIASSANKEKIFINYSNVPKLLETYLKPEYRNEMESLQNFIGFGSYELAYDNNQIAMKGNISGSENNFMPNGFLGQASSKSQIENVISSRTALYMCWNTHNPEKYFTDLFAYRKKHFTGDNSELQWQKLQEQGNFKAGEFYNIIKNEWAFLLPEPTGDEDSSGALLVIKMDSASVGKLDTISAHLQKSGLDKFEALNYRGCRIMPSALDNMPGLVFGKLFSRLINPWYANIEGYTFFANKTEQLKRSIDACLDNESIAANSSQVKFKEMQLPQSNFSLYINPAKGFQLASKYLRDDLLEDYKNNAGLIKGLDGIALQFDNSNSRLALARIPAKDKTAETAWQISLESEAASPPQLLKNLDNTKSVFITDESHNAYLINEHGKILWKKKMDDRLSGEVAAIDLYENDNTQYLFASKNTLYLVDKSGKDAGNYPLHPGSTSMSGVAVFDYTRNKKYNYFIGTKNNRIYGYSANGKPLSGWNPQIIDAPMVLPMKYFTIKDKVYLYGVSNRGTLYTWKTNGEKARKPIELKAHFTNPFKMQVGPGFKECILMSMDTGGTLYKVSLDGVIKKRDFNSLPGALYFDYADVDGNGKNEYIVSGGSKIAAYTKEKKLWKLSTAAPLLYAPQLFEIEGKMWIGYVAEGTNQIFLVSHSGTVYKSFPLTGNSPFIIDDFNNDGGLELVTASEGKKVLMFKLGR
jgi:hypothetical protein